MMELGPVGEHDAHRVPALEAEGRETGRDPPHPLGESAVTFSETLSSAVRTATWSARAAAVIWNASHTVFACSARSNASPGDVSAVLVACMCDVCLSLSATAATIESDHYRVNTVTSKGGDGTASALLSLKRGERRRVWYKW